MKKHRQPRKLVVTLETLRELDQRQPVLIEIVGGQRNLRPVSAASHQDVCCA